MRSILWYEFKENQEVWSSPFVAKIYLCSSTWVLGKEINFWTLLCNIYFAGLLEKIFFTALLEGSFIEVLWNTNMIPGIKHWIIV